MSEHIVMAVKGDLTERVMDKWVRKCWINWAAGNNGNEQTIARFKDELADVANKLAGVDAGPVERLLAETAAICWFALRMHEVHYAISVMSEEGTTLVQSEHDQRRIDRAHRRFMTTLKTLASVRRIAVPAPQIDLARQRVDRVNPGSADDGSGRRDGPIPLPHCLAEGLEIRPDLFLGPAKISIC